MSKLFHPVQEGHDPINRQVFICQDAIGKYVYKPTNGFKSRHYSNEEEEALNAAFERQCAYGHTHADYLPEEEKAEGEEYPMVDDVVPPVEGDAVPPVEGDAVPPVL